MDRVGESGRFRNLLQRRMSMEQQILRTPTTCLQLPAVRRHAGRGFERPTEVPLREPRDNGQISQWDRGRQMRIDVLDDTTELPWGQALCIVGLLHRAREEPCRYQIGRASCRERV